MPSHPDELASHNCLGYVNWSGLPYSEGRFSRRGRLHPVRIRSRFQVNDGRVLRAAALEGNGIILQPESVVREDLDDGRLIQVLAEYAAPARPLYLLFPTRRPQTAKLHAFIDRAVEAFG